MTPGQRATIQFVAGQLVGIKNLLIADEYAIQRGLIQLQIETLLAVAADD